MRNTRLVVYAALLWAGLTGPAWAGFQEGLVAYSRGDYATALLEWRPLAEQGNVHAQHNLGQIYAFGLGLPRNDVEAAKWYWMAAKQGHAQSQSNLGVMYEKGRGVPQNYAEAVKWYRKAVTQGDAIAQNNLGFVYEHGRGVAQNYKKALELYKMAAQKGHAGALNNLGHQYCNGLGVRRNYVECLKWFSLAAARGVEIAKIGRDQVVRVMTPAQIAEAEKLAREWMEKRGK